jgi:hypothetical protein
LLAEALMRTLQAGMAAFAVPELTSDSIAIKDGGPSTRPRSGMEDHLCR